MVRVDQLRVQIGGQTVLADATFQLAPRDRVGVVGRNGTGKTTLLRAILGTVPIDGGRVQLQPNVTVGHLSQESQCRLGITLEEEMLSAFPGLIETRRRLDELQHEIDTAAATGNMDAIDRLVEEMSQAQDEYDRLDGYAVDARIATVLHGLGFDPERDRQRLTDEFSGGWQMRGALAKLLVQQPNLLLLDEPTNHIDQAARTWLEGYLHAYPGSLLLVSHDREILDRICTRIFELDDGELGIYAGNYSAYLKAKAERRAQQEAEHRRRQRLIKRTQAYINKFRAVAARAAQVQSRERIVDRLKQVPGPKPEPRGIRFRFAEAQRGPQQMVAVDHVVKEYDGAAVLRDVTFKLERGDRLALIGPNGAGKSTLLRLLAQLEPPTTGRITLGDDVVVAYFAQHQAEALNSQLSVLEEAVSGSRSGSETAALAVLGRFLLADDAQKPVAALSGGERSRLALTKIVLQPANLLLLDEPTNHLDRKSQEVVEEALKEYGGTVVAASHDQSFLGRIATKVAVVGDGAVNVSLAETAPEDEAALAAAARRRRLGVARAAKDAQRQAVEGQRRDLAAVGAGRT